MPVVRRGVRQLVALMFHLFNARLPMSMTKKSRFLLASWKGIRESVAYRVGAMAIILSLLAGSSLAGTATWNGGDGSWTDTTKWTGDCANGYPSS